MSLWLVGTTVKCERCEKESESVFRILNAYDQKVSLCPGCMREAGEAAIVEAELTGLTVPAVTMDTRVGDAVAVARQELAELIWSMAEGTSLEAILRAPELGIDSSFLGGGEEPEALPEGPSASQRLMEAARVRMGLAGPKPT